MKPQSAKQKGRLLQIWFSTLLMDLLGLANTDIVSRPMGSRGEDLIIGDESRKLFPYSIECKNQEAVNVWKSYEQAKYNSNEFEPLLVIKRNRVLPLVVVDAKHFVSLIKKINEYEKR